MTLTCPLCGMEIKFNKEVWMLRGISYHPECIQDNKNLYAQWKVAKEGDGR